MASGHVAIGGNGFVLIPRTVNGRKYLVRPYSVVQTADVQAILEASPDYRGGDVIPVKYRIPYRGLGLKTIRKNRDGRIDPDSFNYGWDSENVNTAWGSQASMALGAQDSILSVSNVSRNMRASEHFKGQIHGLFEGETAEFDPTIHSANFTGSSTTWGAGTNDKQVFTNAAESVALDIMAQKTSLLALFANGDDHHVYLTTNPFLDAWDAPTTDITLALLTNDVTAHEDIDAGLLADIGGEAVAVLWHEDNGTITFSSSTDAGANWTDEGVDIASGNGPQGVAVMAGADGFLKLFVGTREAIYEVDTEPATWTFNPVYVAPVPHNDNFRRMTVGQILGTKAFGIWFGLGVDDNTPAPVGILYVEGGHYSAPINEINGISLGPAAKDGCAAKKLGPIRWWKAAGQFMFAAVGGGAASRNAWIMCHNGFGWHCFHVHGTANQKIQWMDISADDDGIPRLHYAVRTEPDNVSAQFLALPLSNPRDGQSYTFYDGSTVPGFWQSPEFNLDSTETKNLLTLAVEGSGLGTTSAEYFNVDFGIDRAAPDNTNLGDITSTTSKLSFGSDAGVAATSWSFEVNFFNKTGISSTPFYYGTEIRAEPRYAAKAGYEMLIDLEASARLQGKSIGEVTGQLYTARDTDTLVTFQYSPIAQTRVRIPIDGMSVYEDLESDVTSDVTTSQRHGVVALLRCVER